MYHVMVHEAEEAGFPGVPSAGGTDGLLLSTAGRFLPNP